MFGIRNPYPKTATLLSKMEAEHIQQKNKEKIILYSLALAIILTILLSPYVTPYVDFQISFVPFFMIFLVVLFGNIFRSVLENVDKKMYPKPAHLKLFEELHNKIK